MLLDTIKSYATERRTRLLKRKDRHETAVKGPPRPAVIDGATWQAGVTFRNSEFRVFIDGEPAPLCFAANPRRGWALVYLPKYIDALLGDRSMVASPAVSDFLRQVNGVAVIETITGRVELRPCPNE